MGNNDNVGKMDQYLKWWGIESTKELIGFMQSSNQDLTNEVLNMLSIKIDKPFEKIKNHFYSLEWMENTLE